jgi:hypothetical protein
MQLFRFSLTYGLGMGGRLRRRTAFATRWYMYMREADMRNLNDARTAFAARAAMTTAATVMVMTCTRTANNSRGQWCCRWDGTIA